MALVLVYNNGRAFNKSIIRMLPCLLIQLGKLIKVANFIWQTWPGPLYLGRLVEHTFVISISPDLKLQKCAASP